VKVAEARSDGGCWPGQVEVGNDRVRALLEADQEVERIALLLGARTQDTGDDRLRRGAARRAVAPADLSRHDGRADRLFRLPVGRFDVGAAQAREERGPLGPEMLEGAAVQRMREAPGEEPGGAGVEAAERDGQPVPRERARVPAIAERQRRRSTRRTACGKRAAPRWAVSNTPKNQHHPSRSV